MSLTRLHIRKPGRGSRGAGGIASGVWRGLFAGMVTLGAAGALARGAEQRRPEAIQPGGAHAPSGQNGYSRGGANDKPGFEVVARAELTRNIKRLGTESARTVYGDIDSLFNLYLAHGAINQDSALLVDLAAARRLAGQLSNPENEAGKRVLPLLLANPQLATTLVFSVRPEDDIPGVYTVLEKLARKYPADVTDRSGFVDLVVAVCVVFDKHPAHPSLGRGTPAPNPAIPPTIDPVEVFGFFRSSWNKLEYRDRLPVELLTHVVDVHSTIDELRWAQKNYGGNQAVGRVYSSIVYDTAAFKFGQQKKVFKDGYTLENIKKCGGVCTEQAFFASEVAKAIGVPSVYITGEGSDVGHAWVGYLKNIGSRSAWDFTEGRFGEYKKTQGAVTDAHTDKPTSDAIIGLTEWEMTCPKAALRTAAAKTDAAVHLAALGEKPGAWPPAWPGGEIWGEEPKGTVHGAGAADALEMLHGALTACAGYEPAWKQLAVWAQKGKLDSAAKKRWGDLIMKMAGRDRPDFAMAMLVPMIQSAGAPEEQSKLWDWAATEFHARPDLVSRARLSQGQCWEKAGENGKAWDAYKDVITRFPNEGKSIVYALMRSEILLHKNGKDGSIVGLYEDAFRRVSKPAQMSPGFESASNYYMVGERYAILLQAAGREADARRVKRQIGIADEPASQKRG